MKKLFNYIISHKKLEDKTDGLIFLEHSEHLL